MERFLNDKSVLICNELRVGSIILVEARVEIICIYFASFEEYLCSKVNQETLISEIIKRLSFLEAELLRVQN